MGLTGSKVEKICDLCHITLNKVSHFPFAAVNVTSDSGVQNAVVGDTSAATPGGVRIGTAAVTSRSMNVEHMATIAGFLDRAVQISLALQKEAGTKKLVDFVRVATEGNGEGKQQLEKLSDEVMKFATSFPLPGVPVSFPSLLFIWPL